MFGQSMAYTMAPGAWWPKYGDWPGRTVSVNHYLVTVRDAITSKPRASEDAVRAYFSLAKL